jgi:hypothetical protein
VPKRIHRCRNCPSRQQVGAVRRHRRCYCSGVTVVAVTSKVAVPTARTSPQRPCGTVGAGVDHESRFPLTTPVDRLGWKARRRRQKNRSSGPASILVWFAGFMAHQPHQPATVVRLRRHFCSTVCDVYWRQSPLRHATLPAAAGLAFSLLVRANTLRASTQDNPGKSPQRGAATVRQACASAHRLRLN